MIALRQTADKLDVALRTPDEHRAWLAKESNVDRIRADRDARAAMQPILKSRGAHSGKLADNAECIAEDDRVLGRFCAEVTGGSGRKKKSNNVLLLSDLDITRIQSSRWQKISSLSEDQFAEYVQTRRAKVLGVVDSVSVAAVSDASGYDGDEWYTPAKYVEAAREVLGGIDLDPASNERAQRTVQAKRFYTKDDDGLSKPWVGRVWCNPPYSHPMGTHFANKFCDEVEAGNVIGGVFLQNASTDTGWFHRLAPHCLLCFPYRRIAFLTPDGVESRNNRYGQIFFYHGPDGERFGKVFDALGLVVTPQGRVA